jgi:hypothetical protein
LPAKKESRKSTNDITPVIENSKANSIREDFPRKKNIINIKINEASTIKMET